MSINVAQITARLRALLVDDDVDEWDDTFIHESLYEAHIEIMRLLVVSNKDVPGVRADLTLVAGAVQTLPDTVSRLSSVTGNVGMRQLDRHTFESLALMDQCWRDETQIMGIEAYVYDKALPLEFWVYPKAVVDDVVQITYLAKPIKITDATETIELDDDYYTDMVEYCLYRAYQRESVEGKWSMYKQSFYQGIGMKLDMDMKAMAQIKDNVARGYSRENVAGQVN